MKSSKIFKIVAMAIISFAAIVQAAVIMTDGKIIDNVGGGVTTNVDGSSVTITIGGTAVISGNVSNEGSSTNLRLRNNGYLAISTTDPPQAGMSVGVTKPDNDFVFVQSDATSEHTQYFFADQNNYGVVNFFVGATALGRPLSGTGNITGKLTIYDATGNVVRKIDIRNDIADGRTQFAPTDCVVGSWDLRDSKNRPVSTGAYLAHGVITIDGKREKVSMVIGVR